MAGYVSLFEELGLPSDASDADVEIAYERKKREAEQAEKPVSDGVTYAYRLLHHEAGRRAYVEFLRHCDERIPIQVPAERLDEFRGFWAFAGLRAWPDPKRLDLYHLRRPDQEPPAFVLAGPPRPSIWRQYGRELWRFLTFQHFFGANRNEAIGLVIMYVLLIGGIATGIDWVSTRFGSWQESRLRSSLEDHLALAESGVSQVGADVNRFSKDYREVTGASLGESSRSPEIDRLILEEGSVAQALAEIENLRLKEDELSSARSSLLQIRSRIARTVYRNEDDDELERLIRWCEDTSETLPILESKLEHIRVMLRVSSFEKGLDETERTNP
ncbi:MAG: hypothetical protein AB7O38_07230 [Pirellulaceae bacterium]